MPMPNTLPKFKLGFLTGRHSTVSLLVGIAVGSVLFLTVAAWTVYGNSRRLITAAEWVDHTKEVLTALQRVSLLIERIEYRSRLYTLTKNEEQLSRARSSENQLETTLVRLKFLVSDNQVQLATLQRLDTCTRQLSESLNNFDLNTGMAPEPLKQCYEAVGVMTDEEQRLLQERSKGSQRSTSSSLFAQILFVGLCLVGLMVLFGFLLRDAFLKTKAEDEINRANARLAETVREMENRARESQLLTSARDELQLCVDVQQVYEAAARSLGRLLEGTSGSLCIINNSRQLVEVVSAWHSGLQDGAVDFHPPESCCGLRSGQARWRMPGTSEIHCTHFKGEPPERYLCRPISAHGNTLGVLCVVCDSDAQIAAVNARVDGLRQLLQLTGMAIATLNLRTKLENQSIRDSLTGLFNRHFMQISLEREISRAARRQQALAVFMMDLDHFKTFNDTHGHAAGDAVLKAAAAVFTAHVRAEDIACRYGGEEFTIILPDLPLEFALDRAEGIRRAVELLRVPIGRDTIAEVRVSVGVAVYPIDGETGDELLHRADLALYRAKRNGRNQVAQYESAVTMA